MNRIKHKKPFVYYLALWGCISTGIIYLAIGVIAILSFLRVKDGGADESSLLVFFDEYGAGKVLLWTILSGMVAFIGWRVYEVIKDPYQYGSSAAGRFKRLAVGLSSLPDAMIAITCIQVMMGNSKIREKGPPVTEQQFAGELMQQPWGTLLIMLIGAGVCIVALIQFGYVISKAYLQRINMENLSTTRKKLIYALGFIGYFARGIIIGIIGYFFIKAAVYSDASYIVNTDKAFDAIGDDVGHIFFILVALATICYGFFMFLCGYYYDTDKH